MTITETLAVQGGGPVASLAISCSKEVTDVQYTVTGDWGMYFPCKKSPENMLIKNKKSGLGSGLAI
jgi:hypothetical protein